MKKLKIAAVILTLIFVLTAGYTLSALMTYRQNRAEGAAVLQELHTWQEKEAALLLRLETLEAAG